MLLSGKSDRDFADTLKALQALLLLGTRPALAVFLLVTLIRCLPSRPLTLLIRNGGAFVLRGGLRVLCRRLGVRGCSWAGMDRRLCQSLAPRVRQVRRTRSGLLQLWKKEEGFREALGGRPRV